MSKTITRISLLIILTLTLTQLAPAAWVENEFTNNSSSDVYVAFSTLRPADTERDIPAGWRTVGWYRIRAGGAHTFWAQDDNRIYYLIFQGGNFLKPAGAQSFTSLMSQSAFVIVTAGETGFDDEITYTNQSRATLTENANFFNSENGGPVTVTNTGVTAPRAKPLDDITIDLPPNDEDGMEGGEDDMEGGEDDTEDGEGDTVLSDGDGDGTSQPTQPANGLQATITASVDGQALDTVGTGPVQVVTNAPIQITVQLRRNGRLTRGTLFFSVEGPTGTTLDKREGSTDTEAKVTTLLTLGTSEGQYKFIVKSESDALEDDPATQIDETAPIKLGELIFEASEGPGAAASAIVISGPNALDPRGGSVDGRISLTFKVTTPADNPVPNAPVSVTRLSGPAIENLPAARPRTNTQGEARLTFRLVGGSTGDLKIRASVGEAVATKTITVRHTLGSVSFTNTLPSSINSGGTDTVEVQALSKNGTAMSGVSIRFSTNSSKLRFIRSSGTTSSSGKFSTTVQTKGKTSGSWSGTRYNATGRETITATASHVSVNRSTTDWTTVLPSSREVQTSAEYFGSRGVGLFDSRDWYWTGWRNLSLTSSQCSQVITWWGYASVSVVDDPYVDEELIENEDSRSIQKTGSRTWRVRVRIREHKAEQNEVWVRVKARCEVVDNTFGAPSLPQLSLHPETRHLSETWQELSQVPSETALLPNYPNPFNPETWIPYHLSDPAEVTLSIYSADGRLVRTLALGHQAAGIYESKSRAAYWDGRNAVGERVASGLYFYTLTAGDFAATGKMLIMK